MGSISAWLNFGIFFPTWHRGAFPTMLSHSVHDPQLTPELRPNKRWFINFRGCGFVDCVKNGACFASWHFAPNIYPASAPLPNLQASAERTKNQLSNACLRSRNGGVGAEICLRKVKWDCLAGRGVSCSWGRPLGTQETANFLMYGHTLQQGARTQQHPKSRRNLFVMINFGWPCIAQTFAIKIC